MVEDFNFSRDSEIMPHRSVTKKEGRDSTMVSQDYEGFDDQYDDSTYPSTAFNQSQKLQKSRTVSDSRSEDQSMNFTEKFNSDIF
jgi:hypothetical protein